MYPDRATNDHFGLFSLREKHHSEKLVMLELTNHILPKQALLIVMFDACSTLFSRWQTIVIADLAVAGERCSLKGVVWLRGYLNINPNPGILFVRTFKRLVTPSKSNGI